MPANKPGKWIEPAAEPLSAVGHHSRHNAGNRDDGPRTEKPESVGKMRSFGWHPYMRQRIDTVFRLD